VDARARGRGLGKIWWAVIATAGLTVAFGAAWWALSPRTITETTIRYVITGPNDAAGPHTIFENLAPAANKRFHPAIRNGRFPLQQGSACSEGAPPDCQAEGSIVVGGPVSFEEALAFMESVPIPPGFALHTTIVGTQTRSISGCPRC
jgi:hypothetical protein